jgi:hypothetical protein
MSSTALGTFLGRAKNFRYSQDGRALADLFLSADAKDTPNGNLFDYVLNMAQNNADMLGLSIVFTPGKEYRRGVSGEKVYPDSKEFDSLPEPTFIELEKLHAVDMVDDPAANAGGLFSTWAADTIAGAVTEFLDLHPDAFAAVEKHPEIIPSFFERYNTYRKKLNKKELTITMENEATNTPAADAVPDQLSLTPNPSPTITITPVEVTALNNVEVENDEILSDAAEFTALKAEADEAQIDLCDAVEYADELQSVIDEKDAELESLKARLASLGKTGEKEPPQFSEAPTGEKKPLWHFRG